MQKNVVGIFDSPGALESAFVQLRAIGIPSERINMLLPGSPELSGVPVSETEQPGVAAVLGAVVGGASGATAGLAATVLIPGIGTVTAIGLAAAAAFGAAGAVSGAVAGRALEATLDNGLPADELYVYEDALRQGRIVVAVEAASDAELAATRRAFDDVGAESIDAAREQWWTGLRSAEEAEYRTGGSDFAGDEAIYRCGFEVAQLPGAGGKSYSEALSYLHDRFSHACEHPAFRRGYERGRLYRQNLVRQSEPA